MSSVCPFYKQGACRFGNRCRNSHDLSSSSAASKDCEENPEETSITVTSESEQNNSDFDTAQNLKIKNGTYTITNPLTGETIKGSEKYVISEFIKKLRVAEKEINTLNQKLQDKCERNYLLCTERDGFQLNDSYLHCTICYELFIKPMVLNCSHTFCQWCIDTWSSVNHECPICREMVVNKSYCLNLDNHIKHMISVGPTEMKKAYKLLEEKRTSEGPKNIAPDNDDDLDRYIQQQVNPFQGYYSI